MQFMKSLFHKTISTFTFIALFGSNLLAANITWIGQGSAFQAAAWENPSNWSGGAVPTATDDVSIPAGSEANITLNSAVAVRNFTFGEGHLSGSGSLTINGELNWENPMAFYDNTITFILAVGATFNLETPPLYTEGRYAGPFVVQGAMTLKAGFFGSSNFQVTGTLNWVYGNIYSNVSIATGGTLNLGGSLEGYQRLVDDTLTNNGVINWTASELRTAGGLILNNGTMNVSAPDNIITGGFPPLGTEIFRNTGVLNLNLGSGRFFSDIAFENTGTINLNGGEFFANNTLSNGGIIDGQGNGLLTIAGGGLNQLLPGSELRNLQRVKTAYPYMSTRIDAGAQFSNIGLFHFEEGNTVSNAALPAASNYRVGSWPIDLGRYGGWEQNVDMSFSATLELGYGILNGSGLLTLNTDNATLNGCFVGSNVVIPAGRTFNVGQSGAPFNIYMGYLGSIGNVPGGSGNMTNNGIINVNGAGIWGSDDYASLINNGQINVLSDSALIGSTTFYNPQATGQLLNNGLITCGNTTQFLHIGYPLLNNSSVVLPVAADLSLTTLEQNGILKGSGGALSVWGAVANFNSGSTLNGFSKADISAYEAIRVKNGCNLIDIPRYIFRNSNDVQLQRPMPNEADYRFESALVNLAFPLNSVGEVACISCSVSGNGSLNISDAFEWVNGVIDVPVNIAAGALASISTDSANIFTMPSPTISAPFSNAGLVTWLNGAILLDNAPVVNDGAWEIDAPADVLMSGPTTFSNNGTLSNCGATPVVAVFQTPVVNNGTIQGSGTYDFAGGLSNNGNVNPGCSPGHLTIAGNFNAGQAINIEILGSAAHQHDHLQIGGNMVAGGVLNLLIAPGTQLNGPLPIIESNGAMSGAFSQINVPAGYSVAIVNNAVELSALPALPVELSYFNVRKQAATAALSWETATERDAERFEVEHSTDGRSFRSIGMRSAAGTSQTPRQYNFIHENPVLGANYYRLRQVDRDGSSTYSDMRMLAFNTKGLRILSNPVREVLSLQLAEAGEAQLTLEISDAAGRVVRSEVWRAGSDNFKVDISGLNAGIYRCRLLETGENLNFVVAE
jgi:hypothetical protein